MGPHVVSAALPHGDPDHAATLQSGVNKRFAIETPTPDTDFIPEISSFVRKWIESKLTPLKADSDDSVSTWLSETNYPLYRRQELLEKNKNIIDEFDPKIFKVKSFMKDEVYPEYKHVRAINSRSDEFKTLVGPIFKLIEKEVFKLDWFIKKIPVKDRPNYIMNKLSRPDGVYFATDYTAYEAHFTSDVMEAIEFQLYDYMTQNLPAHDQFMWYMRNVLAGRNYCSFKLFDVEVDAVRMSGEMNTSLGNGFANLMLFLYMAQRKGCTNVDGVVEGDDGLFVLEGPDVTEDDARRCGFLLKIEKHLKIETASFCGIVFAEEDRNNLTNPLAELVNFGWTTGQYARSKNARHKELLRSKALSLYYQYPGCPILSALARYAIRCTCGYKAQLKYFRNMWEREQFMEALKYVNVNDVTPVGFDSRLLVEKLYGVTVADQVRTEKYLDSLDKLLPLNMPWLEKDYHSHWMHYSLNYTTQGVFKDTKMFSEWERSQHDFTQTPI